MMPDHMANTSTHRLGFMNCEEVTRPLQLKVKGDLPDWVEGRLYRNGPGVFDIATARGKTVHIDHWFDGLAVLHRFQIENGQVTYSSRHLAAGLQRYIQATGRTDYLSFANDPCLGLFQKVMTLFRRKVVDPESGERVQNLPVTVGHLGQNLMVTRTDANLLQAFDPDTLEPEHLLSYSDINPKFDGQLSAAHPQHDLSKGEYLNYVLKLGRTGRYTVFCIPDGDPDGHVLATLEAPPSYIHSFALTKRYFILTVFPATIHPLRLLWTRNIVDSMSWDPDQGTMFYVIDRQRKKLKAVYRSKAFFAFHHVNAWEDGDDGINIDLSAYNDLAIVDLLRLQRLRSSGMSLTGELRRYRLADLARADPDDPRPADYTVLSGTPCELPRINQQMHMIENRFVYGVSGSTPGSVWDRLVKVDTGNGATRTWGEEDCYPGEPIFVASPKGRREDSGVVLSVVLDARSGTSFLLVLDASSFTELARADNAPRVPFGFHGNFYGAGLHEE